jgi:hypothetical protein
MPVRRNQHVSPIDPNKHLEDKNAALNSTFSIASVGIATLDMLETLLPAAAKEVEVESRDLSKYFMTLAEYLRHQKDVPDNVRQAMSGIVIGMQFQDRNTQIMENVVGILERYRTMLVEICGNIESMRDGHIAPDQDISKAVENILSGIRLSDIRTRDLEALAKAKVPHDDSDTSSNTISNTNSIELF